MMSHTPELPHKRRRELTTRVLAKIGSQPSFRQQIIDDPELALIAAGFGELHLATSAGEVGVWACSISCPQSCGYTCIRTGRKPIKR
jgi:hypothetical protein